VNGYFARTVRTNNSRERETALLLLMVLLIVVTSVDASHCIR